MCVPRFNVDLQHKSPKSEWRLCFRWLEWWRGFAKRRIELIISCEPTSCRISDRRNLFQCAECSAEFLEYSTAPSGDQRRWPRRVPSSPNIPYRPAPSRFGSRRLRARVSPEYKCIPPYVFTVCTRILTVLITCSISQMSYQTNYCYLLVTWAQWFKSVAWCRSTAFRKSSVSFQMPLMSMKLLLINTCVEFLCWNFFDFSVAHEVYFLSI